VPTVLVQSPVNAGIAAVGKVVARDNTPAVSYRIPVAAVSVGRATPAILETVTDNDPPDPVKSPARAGIAAVGRVAAIDRVPAVSYIRPVAAAIVGTATPLIFATVGEGRVPDKSPPAVADINAAVPMVPEIGNITVSDVVPPARVKPVALEVIDNPLTEVAAATPRIGVIRVGVVCSTLLPVPVFAMPAIVVAETHCAD